VGVFRLSRNSMPCRLRRCAIGAAEGGFLYWTLKHSPKFRVNGFEFVALPFGDAQFLFAHPVVVSADLSFPDLRFAFTQLHHDPSYEEPDLVFCEVVITHLSHSLMVHRTFLTSMLRNLSVFLSLFAR